MSVPLVTLVGIGAKSVSTVAACACVGAYAHRAGVLSGEAQKGLSKMIQSIFLPCLILEKVASNMSVDTLLDVWPLGVMCVTTVVYGLGLGMAVGHRIPAYKPMIMVAIAFPNSFSVPLTLMLALGDVPALLDGGRQVGGEVLAARVNLLFMMSYSIWVLARWSIGYPVLSGALSFAKWRRKVLNPPVVASLLGAVVGLAYDAAPVQVRPNDANIQVVLQPFRTALQYAGRCSIPAILLTLGAELDKALSDLWAAPKQSRALGKEAPLLDIEELTTGEHLPAGAYVSVFVLRQLVGPIFGAAVGCGLLRGLFGVTEPVVLMVGMLQCAGPPMISLAVMSGLQGGAEKETAKLLLFTYAFSIVTWTASIAFFLFLLTPDAS